MQTPESTYPVISEIWDILETTLQNQAKRLVEDIAKHQKADSKELWNKVRRKIKISLADIRPADNLPTTCPYPVGASEGAAIHLRCRAPCVLGFSSCPKHATGVVPSAQTTYESVDRITDMHGNTYFLDQKGIARDKQGKPRGYVNDSVLYLFEESEKSSTNT
jgi:hypothetical protein